MGGEDVRGRETVADERRSYPGGETINGNVREAMMWRGKGNGGVGVGGRREFTREISRWDGHEGERHCWRFGRTIGMHKRKQTQNVEKAEFCRRRTVSSVHYGVNRDSRFSLKIESLVNYVLSVLSII
jgi:hypothetical protein